MGLASLASKLGKLVTCRCLAVGSGVGNGWEVLKHVISNVVVSV